MSGDYSEKRLGVPVKINKPRVARKKKDPAGQNVKPKFTNAGKSQTMKVEKPKTSGYKTPSTHPHKSKTKLGKGKRAK